MDELSVQERYAPKNRCFGCGPRNEKGLRIRSFERGDALVCEWRAEDHHLAFDGALAGGVAGTLLDCHGNWAAAMRLMKLRGMDRPPCTVTARYCIDLKRPTPLHAALTLFARVVKLDGDRATVEAHLESDGQITATCTGTFVAVEEGHPAFHRW
jgi:acyl-coenzyme A thioesterase PaaI-like protein